MTKDLEAVSDETYQKQNEARNDGFSIVKSANGTVVTGLGFDNQDVTLDEECLLTLNWPVETYGVNFLEIDWFSHVNRIGSIIRRERI